MGAAKDAVLWKFSTNIGAGTITTDSGEYFGNIPLSTVTTWTWQQSGNAYQFVNTADILNFLSRNKRKAYVTTNSSGQYIVAYSSTSEQYIWLVYSEGQLNLYKRYLNVCQSLKDIKDNESHISEATKQNMGNLLSQSTSSNTYEERVAAMNRYINFFLYRDALRRASQETTVPNVLKTQASNLIETTLTEDNLDDLQTKMISMRRLCIDYLTFYAQASNNGASSTVSVDYSSYILNHTANFGTGGWELSGVTSVGTESDNKYFHIQPNLRNDRQLDLQQKITGLPEGNGSYELSFRWQAANGETVQIINSNNTVSGGDGTNSWKTPAIPINCSANTDQTLSISLSGRNYWSKFDDFSLTYRPDALPHTKTQPLSAAGAIYNASFEGTEGWTGTSGTYQRVTSSNTNDDNGMLEITAATGEGNTVQQTITNLPMGWYTLDCKCRTESSVSVEISVNKDAVATDDVTASTVTNTSWESAGQLQFLVTDQEATITLKATGSGKAYVDALELKYIGINELQPGMELTYIYINNPGFEQGNLTSSWIRSSDNSTVKSTSDPTVWTLGAGGNWQFHSGSAGNYLVQNLGILPPGVYRLEASVCSEPKTTQEGVTYLFVCSDALHPQSDARYSYGRMTRQQNTNVMRKETLTFISDGSTPTAIGVCGGSKNGSYAPELTADNSLWYKADDFKLFYLGTEDELETIYTTAWNETKPEGGWNDNWPSDTYSYKTWHNNLNNPEDQLAAINRMRTQYDDYLWEVASPERPYWYKDLEDYCFKFDKTFKTTDGATGAGREMAEGTRPDGTQGKYLYANYDEAWQQGSIAIPWAGAYRLYSYHKRTSDDARTFIDICCHTVTFSGATSGSPADWQREYTTFGTSDINKSGIVRVAMTKQNSYVGGMNLAYIGPNATKTIDGVQYYFGVYSGNQAVTPTEAAPNICLHHAKIGGNVTFDRATNPNGLIYVTEKTTVTGDNTYTNVVYGHYNDGSGDATEIQCDRLVLVDGHAFMAGTSFTAKDIKYTLSTVGTIDGQHYATLCLPFKVTGVPTGTKFYRLTEVDKLSAALHPDYYDVMLTEFENIDNIYLRDQTPVIVSGISGGSTLAGSNGQVKQVALGETSTANLLCGVYQPTTPPADSYILQNQDGDGQKGVGFYPVPAPVPESYNNLVGAFRAYITPLNDNMQPRRIRFVLEDGTVLGETGDDEAQPQTINATYDLSGRRTQPQQRGLYIRNGKKVIIK